MRSAEIRREFIEFFKKRHHEIVDSAPMVIKDDPTLMFTNAGMNQFKDLFLGNVEIKYSRIADTQKCLRVSGKHNDLEEVGVDTYHHTMFEMLGNWSFGDYFKKEAIEWAWELLVDVYKVDKNRLYVTIFEGDEKDKTLIDQESYEIWKSILEKNEMGPDRILKCDKKDNFWEMGDIGPCGPSSEIHIDIRSQEEIAKVSGRDLVNKDHPEVVEIWNLVFMEFNRMSDGSLKALPQKHVDTGMGFERLAMVLQDKKSNYDTDIFYPFISRLEELTGFKYKCSDSESDIAIRVICDHLRAVSFAIADGQLPSNTGAGYVIRRILRRGIRYGYSFLNIKEPVMFKLVTILSEQMSGVYSELGSQQDLIKKVIKEEEESFLRTLSRGIERFDQFISKSKLDVINGKFVFELYDTFGFPVDLTELLAKEKGLNVDMKAFSEELEKQKNRSRIATRVDSGDWVELKEDEEEEFIGYDYTEIDIFITRYRKIIAKDIESYQLVFNLTPFYPEGGGQVGDTGYIECNGERVEIVDTKKENNLIIHFAKELPTNLRGKFKAVVDIAKRELIAANHTATHLLHESLRDILGTHVQQKGSLVNSNYLRFDFSHFEKVSEDDLVRIEEMVNSKITDKLELKEFREIPIIEAKKMGAMMLFGEKYGDVVRMIQFGSSQELCGGIHVSSSEQIKIFKIRSEGAIAAGVRRIEALTSDSALNWLGEKMEVVKRQILSLKSIVSDDVIKHLEKLYQEMSEESGNNYELTSEGVMSGESNNELSVLSNSINDLIKIKVDKEIIDRLNEQKKQLSKDVEKEGKEVAMQIKEALLGKIEKVDDINVIAQRIELNNTSAIKDLAFQLKNEIKSLFLILGAEVKGKPNLTIALSQNLVEEKNLHAGNIIREAAKEMKGGGGGQPFYATAGGSDLSGIDAAITKAKSFLN